ncbi:22739_t:CDS:1, partial [Gigaspora rosea]
QKEIQIKTLIEKFNQQEEHKELKKENEPTSKCKSKEKQGLLADLKQKEEQFESELFELKNDYIKGKNSEIKENLNILLNRNSS